MEPISLIIAALAAGATAATQGATKEVVTDAYNGLKTLIQRKFADKKDSKGEMALAEHENDPDTWGKPLEKSLTQIDAGGDKNVIAAVNSLINALQNTSEGKTALGKFNIQADKIQGVVQAENVENITLSFGNN